MDKVQKIREEIEKRYRENKADGYSDVCEELWDILSFIDSMQEEPVSESINFEQELYKAFGQVKDFTLCMRIAKRFYDMGKKSREPVSEELEDYINELSKQFPEVSFAKLSRIAVRVAKWQKEKMKKKAVDGTFSFGELADGTPIDSIFVLDKKARSKCKEGDNSIPEEELVALYKELRPIVFRLAEKLNEDDIINLNFGVGSVTFKFY